MQLSARIATLDLAERFVISRGAQDSADVVHVELEHAGETGYGEAAPTTRYEESAESSLAFLEGLDDLGDDPFAHDEIEARLAEHPGQMSAKAAIDAALHDLGGKLTGPAGVALPRAEAGRAADVLDDLARRPRRHGSTG